MGCFSLKAALRGLNLGLIAWSLGASAPCLAYKRASDSGDNVKMKLYPSGSGTTEIAVNGGIILNQSYISTFVTNFGVQYFTSEKWSLGLDYSIASNSDKDERLCIESFYNDTKQEMTQPCGGPENLEALGADTTSNYGPAYVEIRELQNILTFNLTWTPVYGKQLFFYSFTSYFDLFLEMGLGYANSLFYPETKTLKNGKTARGAPPDVGASVDETYAYGIDGRPDPASEGHPLLNLGIGQKMHFAGMFHLKFYIRNLTLIGTESGFDNLFVLYGGLGARF